MGNTLKTKANKTVRETNSVRNEKTRIPCAIAKKLSVKKLDPEISFLRLRNSASD